MYICRRSGVVGLFAILIWAGAAGAASPPELLRPAPGSEGPEGAVEAEGGPLALRARYVEVDWQVLDHAATNDLIHVRFFADAAFDVQLERRRDRGPGAYSWTGHLVGDAAGSFLVVVQDGLILANLWGGLAGDFELRQLHDGRHVAREINAAAFPPCPTVGPAIAPAGLAVGAAGAGGGCVDDGSEIQMLVVYTEAAAMEAGGGNAIDAFITGSEDSTNMAYADSGVATTVTVVSSAQVNYTESGSSFVDRNRLTDPDDGFLDDVHILRDIVAADVVTLLVSTLDGCGRANFSVTDEGDGIPALGFNVVRLGCAVGNFTFAHELGHNQGCRHEWTSDPTVGVFGFAHGYRDPGGIFRTVMATFDSKVPRVGRFSNPDLQYMGLPTGVPLNEPFPTDCSAAIDMTALTVANFRPSLPQDCNDNGVNDLDDIVLGTSADVNDNGVPDECEPSALFVNAAASPGGTGSSWDDAFKDLQDALEATPGPCEAPISEIWVAAGCYTPDRGTGDRTMSFQLRSGMEIYGGFAGDEETREERDPVANPTVLSGDLLGNDLPAFTNYVENSLHVVAAGPGVNATAVLDGFVITGGSADGGCCEDDRGGGLFLDQASPTIRRCIFRANQAVGAPGSSTGGAVSHGSGQASFIDCVFDGNRARSGGAMLHAGEAQLINCLFVGNMAFSGSGGCLYNFDDPVMINCVFSGNSATSKGGVLYNVGGSPSMAILTNCTLAGNTAGGSGGGIYNEGSGLHSPALNNCILWGNSDAGGMDETAQMSTNVGAPTVDFSTVQGLTGALGGTGNIGSDPLFVDADGPDGVVGTADDDLRLLEGSPAIDAANNAALPAEVTTDFDGGPRFVDDPAADCPQAPGQCGTAPIADMGAFERSEAPCPWDCGGDDDGVVTIVDFLVLLAQWGQAATCDVDDSGTVDVLDFLEMLANWGLCP